MQKDHEKRACRLLNWLDDAMGQQSFESMMRIATALPYQSARISRPGWGNAPGLSHLPSRQVQARHPPHALNLPVM